MNDHIRTVSKLALVVVCSAVLYGCSAIHGKDTAACDLPPTRNVDDLFAAVDGRLATPSCQFRYEGYLDTLIASAKASPGPENEARFAELLRSSVERGIISKRRARELFSRYFDEEYYAVKNEARNICSSLRDKPALYAAMAAELKHKREGLLDILDDESRFRQAQHHYADLQTVFDATAIACDTTL